jgi:cytochrome c peroxidase
MNKTKLFLLLVGLGVLACTLEDPPLETAYLDLPGTPYTYRQGTNFGDTSIADNYMATLGRVLFYDKNLSINNSVSCATCHKQSLAFADNVKFSKGFENRLTTRNSMPIQNLSPGFSISLFNNINDGRVALTTNFVANPAFTFFAGGGGIFLFWDGRESNLEEMVLKPIGNHVEMGIRDMKDLATKLAGIPYYADLFQDAYGSPEVTTEKIGQALAAFLLSITSTQTRFDLAQRGQAQLTALERAGQILFTTTYECNACHQIQDPHGYVFAGTFSNIGLDAQDTDEGRGDGNFKIPSLRNVALTAPYMHDGRFKTLEEVIEHYSTGIADNPNLDPRLREGVTPMRMAIPEHEKEAIIAFLNTLTDHQMIRDERFSNPFKVR